MFNTIAIILITMFFLCYMGYSEHCHSKERKQLYSRIQAKDLIEYKRIEEPIKKEKEDKKVVHFV